MSHQVTSFHYTVKDAEGNVIDSSQGGEPLSFLEGSGNIIPGLENEIKGMEIGDKKAVNVVAQEAYGDRNPELVYDVPKSQFPPEEELKIGMMFQTEESDAVLTLTEIKGDMVVLDANHPLAGKDLFFDIEITGRREASQEEIDHGHVHDGHHHH